MITLRHLSFFIALIEEQNFTRAAQKCFVTQPTLSSGLRELELRLNVILFERDNKNVRLTEFGRKIEPKVRDILRQIHDIHTDAAHALQPEEGPLHLGIIPTIAPYLLSDITNILQMNYAKLQIFVHEDITENILQKLHEGAIDLGIIALPFDTGSLKTAVIGDDPFYLASPIQEPFWQEERTQPLLLLSQGHCLQKHALSALPGRFHHDTSYATTNLHTLMALVASGFGSTLVPALAVKSLPKTQDTFRLTALKNAQPRQIALVWRSQSVRHKLYENFHPLLCDMFKEIII
ncbi:MAG: hydrogen peroxide-inducible genes activator, partial [Alphaproteobacteria bacterium]|nr:hydrogen peroxide-inducible genes activator [Alphaproteobacteria bacterium]